MAILVQKDQDYLLNHCTNFLARDSVDGRHCYFGTDAGQPRAAPDELSNLPLAPSNRRYLELRRPST